MRRHSWIFLALAGCGGGGGETFDAAIDSAPTIDAPHLCLAPMDLPLTTTDQMGFGLGVDHADPDAVVMEGTLAADLKLRIELLSGFGVFLNGITTGSFPIENDKLNNQTCGVCVHIIAGPPGDQQQYFATSGEVTINMFDSNIAGAYSSLQFEEVEIDPTTMHSAPYPDGCHAVMAGSGAFDTTVTWE